MMSKTISRLLLLLVFTPSITFSQIDSGDYVMPISSCNFETNCQFMPIADSASVKLWETGIPSKALFNAAYSLNRAIVTDTAQAYPGGIHDWFDVKIGGVQNYFLNPLVSFYHRVNTDTLSDGGWIEISYDMGLNWLNIVYDSLNGILTPRWNSEKLYRITDLLPNGEPGFSGNTNGWQQVKFQWAWFITTKESMLWPVSDTIMLRFHFISDSIGPGLDGWMIDDFRIDNVTFASSVTEVPEGCAIFPNPASACVNFVSHFSRIRSYRLLNNMGIVICLADINAFTGKIDLENLSPGIYLLDFTLESGEHHCRKLLKY